MMAKKLQQRVADNPKGHHAAKTDPKKRKSPYKQTKRHEEESSERNQKQIKRPQPQQQPQQRQRTDEARPPSNKEDRVRVKPIHCDEDENDTMEHNTPVNRNTHTATQKSTFKPLPLPPPPPPRSKRSKIAVTTADHPDAFTAIQPPLSPGILQYLQAHHFTTMTPVQAATLPHFLTHKDVAVQAVTGSGKTLAFLIPCMEMILRRTTLLTARQVGVLILSPTRELAQQTYSICTELCQYCSLPPPLLLVGGGGPVTEDLRLFQQHKSDIVIGTPGRMEDVLTRYNVMDVSELECLILDEADVLLDMGFDMTLQHILGHLPKMRRTGLFSATGTAGAVAATAAALKTQRKSLQHLAQKSGMRNPIWIHVAIASSSSAPTKTSDAGGGDDAMLVVGENDTTQTDPSTAATSTTAQHQATPSSLINYYMITPLEEKISRLYAFLESHRQEKVIVFFLTCASVEFYGKSIQQLWKLNHHTNNNNNNNKTKNEVSAMTMELLHGKMVQKRRECAVERFRKCLTTTTTHEDGGDDEIESNEEESKERAATTTTTSGAFLFCTDVASRGLDITDVDWVVQFDAPQGEPSSYVHRVGRCARAGRSGCSLLFLTPKEEAYVDLLRMRHVPLVPLPTTERCAPSPPQATPPTEPSTGDDDDDNVEDMEGVESTTDAAELQVTESGERIIQSAADPSIRLVDVLPKIRDMVLKDRDLLEKGTKAFTSYIRAYKDHHCSFIFRFPSLDLGTLATSFCLLRLPKMPELRDQLQKVHKTFAPAGPEVDIHAIPFLDKVREEARQKRLAAVLAAGGKNAKQIKAEQRQAARLKKEQERRQASIANGRNPDKKRGRNAQIMDEWEDLAKEERLFKKLRRGKINKEQYKKLMYGDDDKEVSESEQDSSASDSE